MAKLHLTDPHPDSLANLPPEIWLAAVVERNSRFEGFRGSARAWNNMCALEHDFGLPMACALTWGAAAGHTVFESLQLMWRDYVHDPDVSGADIRLACRAKVIAEYTQPELEAGEAAAAEGI